jgi:hypothetical protein
MFVSFPFIFKYKFCVMFYYEYLKMKTIKIVYSRMFFIQSRKGYEISFRIQETATP